jgi:hypothetical protein
MLKKSDTHVHPCYLTHKQNVSIKPSMWHLLKTSDQVLPCFPTKKKNNHDA